MVLIGTRPIAAGFVKDPRQKNQLFTIYLWIQGIAIPTETH